MFVVLLLSLLCLSIADNCWWTPKPGTSWQWQLTDYPVDTSFDVAVILLREITVKMYDIDLFEVPQATINFLHSQNRIVICYFSAGSWENWRPDANQFPSSVIGNDLDGWPGEKWLDIRSSTVRQLMQARMDLAVQKKCDGLEPDNVDGYQNDPGFPLTADDQLDYNRFLAYEGHSRNLSVGLKNDLDQINELVPLFDWALNEQCNQYSECDTLLPFVNNNKAVFGVEYQGSTSSFCPKVNNLNFDFLKKNLNLDAPMQQCRTYAQNIPKITSCCNNTSCLDPDFGSGSNSIMHQLTHFTFFGLLIFSFLNSL